MRMSIIAGALALAASAGASAQVVTFNFTGRVTASTDDADGTPLAPRGTPVTGSFSYDPSTPGHVFGDIDGRGKARYTIDTVAPPAMHVKIGGHVLESTSMGIAMLNDWGSSKWMDAVDMTSLTASVDGQPFNVTLYIKLASDPSDAGALTGLALPTRFDIAKFPRQECSVYFSDLDGRTQEVFFRIETLENPPAADAAS